MTILGVNSLIAVGTQTLATEYESAKAQLEGNDTHTQVCWSSVPFFHSAVVWQK